MKQASLVSKLWSKREFTTTDPSQKLELYYRLSLKEIVNIFIFVYFELLYLRPENMGKRNRKKIYKKKNKQREKENFNF